jgi:hypothetical protein
VLWADFLCYTVNMNKTFSLKQVTEIEVVGESKKMEQNIIEAYKLLEGNEIFILGNHCLVEAVTAFGPDRVLVHTTIGSFPLPTQRWVRVLS